MGDDLRTLAILIAIPAAGAIFLLFRLWIRTRYASSYARNLMYAYARELRTKIEIPEHQYLLVFHDFDLGACMARWPDPPPLIVKTLDEVEEILERNRSDGDLRILVIDSAFHLLAYQNDRKLTWLSQPIRSH